MIQENLNKWAPGVNEFTPRCLYTFIYQMCEPLGFKERWHEYSHLDPFPLKTWMRKERKGGGRAAGGFNESTFISFFSLWFIFIPNNYLAALRRSCAFWYLVLSGQHNVSQQSTYAWRVPHLQGRRCQLSQSSMSQRIFLSLLWHTTLLCLTWSPFTVSLLLVSSGSGSYSNPFLYASDRLILSLLSCCSTWQRIMPGTPFAF